MRKKVYGRQLSRERDSRRALFRALVRALVDNGNIKTTKAKAKAAQPFIDRLINIGKKGTVDARRKVYAKLGNDRKTAEAIVNRIAPALKNRNSGFTRIVNLPQRQGDMAKIVRLEWVKDIKNQVKTKEKKAKGSKSKKK
jgi:large subunit ribosomal protein L17